MAVPTFATEVAGAGEYPVSRFGQRERALLKSIDTHLASASDTWAGKTLTSPVLTTPQINDTSADHQYVFAVSELAADRTVTLPLLTGNDEFVFKAHTQTLTNKTLTTPTIDGDVYGVAEGTISSAEILALNATPKELIAAPGAGKVIIVDDMEFFMNYGSAAYVRDGSNEEFVVEYATTGGDIWAPAVATDTFLTSTADTWRFVKPSNYTIDTGVVFDPMTADNEAVQATITNSEVITGDSDIKYKIRYRIRTLQTT